MVNGISVIICAHNSSSRIVSSLAHLEAQQTPRGLFWEVIIVDNVSTDDTVEVASQSWLGTVPLRIVNELQLGLSYARWRGIHEAQYDIVSFIDDDNWVCPEWVAIVAEIMTQRPNVAACGGSAVGVFESPPPAWFSACSDPGYALGAQANATGDITEKYGALWGAGLSIRKTALEHLRNNGFQSLLTDRKGTSLSSSGDIELCYALRLTGWRLWYDERLWLQHYMPTNRLQWDYLRKLNRGMGASGVGLDPYTRMLSNHPPTLLRRIVRRWQVQLLWELWRLMHGWRKFISYWLHRQEGNPDVLWMDRQLGRLQELIRQRSNYDEAMIKLRSAPWLRVPNFQPSQGKYKV